MLFRDDEAVEQALKCGSDALQYIAKGFEMMPQTARLALQPPIPPGLALRYGSEASISSLCSCELPSQLVDMSAHCAIHTCSPPFLCAATAPCLVPIVYLDARSAGE
jgi:hypothetical protein